LASTNVGGVVYSPLASAGLAGEISAIWRGDLVTRVGLDGGEDPPGVV